MNCLGCLCGCGDTSDGSGVGAGRDRGGGCRRPSGGGGEGASTKGGGERDGSVPRLRIPRGVGSTDCSARTSPRYRCPLLVAQALAAHSFVQVVSYIEPSGYAYRYTFLRSIS